MKTKEQMRTEYEHRSEILELGLRRDEWQNIANALHRGGVIGLAEDIHKFLESKEG